MNIPLIYHEYDIHVPFIHTYPINRIKSSPRKAAPGSAIAATTAALPAAGDGSAACCATGEAREITKNDCGSGSYCLVVEQKTEIVIGMI